MASDIVDSSADEKKIRTEENRDFKSIKLICIKHRPHLNQSVSNRGYVSASQLAALTPALVSAPPQPFIAYPQQALFRGSQETPQLTDGASGALI